MQQIERILCPIDFSEFSETAYDYAQSLAWHYKATLFLQHVTYENAGRKNGRSRRLLDALGASGNRVKGARPGKEMMRIVSQALAGGAR